MNDRILGLLNEARQQLELERLRQSEPIAIVGIGCRLPGNVGSADDFWRLLATGADATRGVPPDRWDLTAVYDPDPDVPGKMYVERGGFLDSIDGFDPSFFGISPREALGMDPQHRLLLEVTWEALEDAGIPATRLEGSATGIWVGLCTDDYARNSVMSGDLTRIDAYASLGNTRSLAAGRIAYFLDLRGPAVQIDTACSSSLVALHQACQSLRVGEVNAALVGGVNLMSSPESTIALCKLRALAPDGRCKTFDASADGYARGEGCGVLVLERLADARAGGRRIYAVVRGSAVNQDGRSNGLTAPSPAAQEAVIRAALHKARVPPAAVSYVETHGTGTLLGDPIEVLALHRAYGADRTAHKPLLIGAVKSNVGHLEGAAGVASVIKVALSIFHSKIPAHINFHRPTPRIAWDTLPISVVAEARNWPQNDKGRVAGVSSFGISGTNAHAIIEESPDLAPSPSIRRRSAELVLVSAKSRDALRESAGRLRRMLEAQPDLQLGDLAYSLLETRCVFEYRLPTAAQDMAALRRVLLAAENGQIQPTSTPASRPRHVFVFPGQGSQWLGMGRELLEEEPVFRESLTACDRAIAAELGWSVISVLRAEDGAPRLEGIDVVQPVLFALQVALAALWRSWGIEPDAVIGHSMGEVAASCVANALSIEDGAAVVCRRSRLLRRISGQGEMALLDLSLEEAKEELSDFVDRVSVAVSNSSRSTVIAGDPAALAEILSRLEARGVFCRRVKVEVASHSPQVDPLLDELISVLVDCQPRSASIPIYSTVTDAVLTGTELDAKYWARNLREPVRFIAAVTNALHAGFTSFVEISPHPLLVTAVEQIRAELGSPAFVVASLRREQPERLTLLQSLGALCTNGCVPDPKGLFPVAGRRVNLPLYAWQHQSYWISRPPATARHLGHAMSHPLLDARISIAVLEALYELELSARRPPWFADHRVGDEIIVAGAAVAELIRGAAHDLHGSNCRVEKLVLQAPLFASLDASRRVQVVVEEAGTKVAVHSQASDAAPAAPWSLHATAEIVANASEPAAPVDLEAILGRCSRRVDVDALYASFARVGLNYGRSFRALTALWRGANEAIGEISLGAGLSTANYGVHPILLDCALQAVAGTLDIATHDLFLPFEFGRFVVHRTGDTRAAVHVELLRKTADSVVANVRLATTAGAIIAEVGDLELRQADLAMVAPTTPSRALYRVDWVPARPPELSGVPAERWLIVCMGRTDTARFVNESLRKQGVESDCISVSELVRAPSVEHLVCIWEQRDGPDEAIRAAQQGLQVAQLLLAAQVPPRLWWMTEKAIAVPGDHQVLPELATLWGLGRTLMQEHPELRCTLVDVDSPSELAAVLLRERLDTHGEEQIAWRQGTRRVARLVAVEDEPGTQTSLLSNSGSVLITGGPGGLGMEVARVCAEAGVGHIILVSRRGATAPGMTKCVAQLEALGSKVTTAAVDVTEYGLLGRVIEAVPDEYPLIGVVHAAGILDDGAMVAQTSERFERVMAAKVRGSWNLHELTRSLDLRFFVLFSSLAGIVGSPGQAGYSAANAFLDALAASRRTQGLPGQSLAWGPWSERGLVAAMPDAARARFARQGINLISPEQGRELFASVLRRADSQLLIAPIERQLASSSFAGAVPPLWRVLAESRTSGNKASAGNWRQELRALAPADRFAAVLNAVQAEVARVLSLSSPYLVQPDRPLKDLGMDSLMALELRRALGHRAQRALPAALIFNHPTPESVASYLLEELTDSNTTVAVRESVPADVVGPVSIKAEVRTDNDALESPGAEGRAINPLSRPRLRLFCFQHAGGQPDVFAPFAQLGSIGVEVHTLSPVRHRAISRQTALDYLRVTTSYVQAFRREPFILLGHSLGSLFAWRTALELADENRLASLLVVSAPPVDPTVPTRPLDGEMVASSALEADTLLWAFMPERAHRPLPVPIAGFLGRDDAIVRADALEPWRACTTRGFSAAVLPGRHFYIYQTETQQQFLAQLEAKILTEVPLQPESTQ